MSEKTKKEIISISITFLSTFLLTVGGLLGTGNNPEINSALIVSICLAGLRSGIKAIVESKLHSVAGINKV
jgi:hypothetical protein